MNEVHAGGVSGGRTDSSVAEAPSFTSLANVGILPSAIQGRMSVQVAASSPMMTALGCFRERWQWFELNGYVVLLVEQHADLVSIKIPNHQQVFFPLVNPKRQPLRQPFGHRQTRHRESSRRDMPSASVGRATQFRFAQPSSGLRSMGNSPGDETGSPVIRVHDEAGNVIETHKHAGEFKEW